MISNGYFLKNHGINMEHFPGMTIVLNYNLNMFKTNLDVL